MILILLAWSHFEVDKIGATREEVAEVGNIDVDSVEERAGASDEGRKVVQTVDQRELKGYVSRLSFIDGCVCSRIEIVAFVREGKVSRRHLLNAHLPARRRWS